MLCTQVIILCGNINLARLNMFLNDARTYLKTRYENQKLRTNQTFNTGNLLILQHETENPNSNVFYVNMINIFDISQNQLY